MLVGGPHLGGDDIGTKTWECNEYRTGKPATSYIDNRCSYATNEVAINWNAPFAYLAGALEAINAGYAPSFAAAGVARNDVGTTAIKPAMVRNSDVKQGPKLRFVDQKLYVEKNGKRFDMTGHRIK